MNLGATAPTESGLYFSWGNTVGHAADSGYIFSSEIYGETAGSLIEADLNLEEDAAHVALGGKWRMPSSDDWSELYGNTVQEWVVVDGLGFLKVTSAVTGNFVMMPAVGLINASEAQGYNVAVEGWLRNIRSGNTAFRMYCTSNLQMIVGNTQKYQGLTIRPVWDPSL